MDAAGLESLRANQDVLAHQPGAHWEACGSVT